MGSYMVQLDFNKILGLEFKLRKRSPRVPDPGNCASTVWDVVGLVLDSVPAFVSFRSCLVC